MIERSNSARYHREHHSAHCRARVDTLIQTDEIDTKVRKLLKGQNQMLCAAGESIEPGNQNGIESTFPGIVHHAIQFRTAIFCATDAFVAVFFDDF